MIHKRTALAWLLLPVFLATLSVFLVAMFVAEAALEVLHLLEELVRIT